MANVVVFGKSQLATLPTKVYMDSNILISAFFRNHRFHKAASRLLFALLAADTELYLSPFSFSESWWVIILAEYERKYKKKLRTDWLKKNMVFINSCKVIFDKFKKYFDKKVQSGRLQIVDVEKQTVENAYAYMLEFPMMPADSFHLAVMKSKGICAIATADKDFDNIPDQQLQIIAIR